MYFVFQLVTSRAYYGAVIVKKEVRALFYCPTRPLIELCAASKWVAALRLDELCVVPLDAA
jgi:hypothetical protein